MTQHAQAWASLDACRPWLYQGSHRWAHLGGGEAGSKAETVGPQNLPHLLETASPTSPPAAQGRSPPPSTDPPTGSPVDRSAHPGPGAVSARGSSSSDEGHVSGLTDLSYQIMLGGQRSGSLLGGPIPGVVPSEAASAQAPAPPSCPVPVPTPITQLQGAPLSLRLPQPSAHL